jgi:hypothetical protein
MLIGTCQLKIVSQSIRFLLTILRCPKTHPANAKPRTAFPTSGADEENFLPSCKPQVPYILTSTPFEFFDRASVLPLFQVLLGRASQAARAARNAHWLGQLSACLVSPCFSLLCSWSNGKNAKILLPCFSLHLRRIS